MRWSATLRRTRPRVGLARATKPYWRRYRASPVMAGPNPSWPARPSWPGWARPSVHVRSYVNDARTRACGCRGSSIAFGGRAGLTIGRSAGASQHWPGTLLGRRFCGATDKTPVANSVNAPWRPGSSRRGAHFPSAVGPVAPMGPADSNVPKYFPINATYAFQTYNPIGDRRSAIYQTRAPIRQPSPTSAQIKAPAGMVPAGVSMGAKDEHNSSLAPLAHNGDLGRQGQGLHLPQVGVGPASETRLACSLRALSAHNAIPPPTAPLPQNP